MYKFTVLAVFVAAVASLPSNLYHAPPTYKEPAKPYSFAYGVQDKYAGTDFGQNEESDGNTVRGSYTVQLPDGRKQTVNYEADHYKGFVAEVNYYGEAQYPKYTGPAITFKPNRGYHPAPAYH